MSDVDWYWGGPYKRKMRPAVQDLCGKVGVEFSQDSVAADQERGRFEGRIDEFVKRAQTVMEQLNALETTLIDQMNEIEGV